MRAQCLDYVSLSSISRDRVVLVPFRPCAVIAPEEVERETRPDWDSAIASWFCFTAEEKGPPALEDRKAPPGDLLDDDSDDAESLDESDGGFCA